jgi:hypothetical protein
LAICVGATIIVMLFAGGSSPDGMLHSLLFHHLQGAYHIIYIYRFILIWLHACQHIYIYN